MSNKERTPDQDTPETATAVAEAPAADEGDEKRSFADRVGRKNRSSAPDPFGIATDNLAGVRLFESKRDRQMAIKFGDGRREDKPSQAVIDSLKDADFRWNPDDRIWAHPVRDESAMSDRIKAERVYQEVRAMIRREKGVEAGQDIPF